jgi:hypothetical protein
VNRFRPLVLIALLAVLPGCAKADWEEGYRSPTHFFDGSKAVEKPPLDPSMSYAQHAGFFGEPGPTGFGVYGATISPMRNAFKGGNSSDGLVFSSDESDVVVKDGFRSNVRPLTVIGIIDLPVKEVLTEPGLYRVQSEVNADILTSGSIESYTKYKITCTNLDPGYNFYEYYQTYQTVDLMPSGNFGSASMVNGNGNYTVFAQSPEFDSSVCNGYSNIRIFFWLQGSTIKIKSYNAVVFKTKK